MSSDGQLIINQIEEQLNYYNPDKFTRLDTTWRGLVSWPMSYYKWLWSAVTVLRPEVLVELGRERGVSTLIMLDALPSTSRFTSIDIVEEAIFLEGLKDPRLTLITSDSLKVSDRVDDINLILIDTEHSYNQVSKEWELYKPKMAMDGIAIFDDIHFNSDMTRFWDELQEDKYDISRWHEPGFGVVFL